MSYSNNTIYNIFELLSTGKNLAQNHFLNNKVHTVLMLVTDLDFRYMSTFYLSRIQITLSKHPLTIANRKQQEAWQRKLMINKKYTVVDSNLIKWTLILWILIGLRNIYSYLLSWWWCPRSTFPSCAFTVGYNSAIRATVIDSLTHFVNKTYSCRRCYTT